MMVYMVSCVDQRNTDFEEDSVMAIFASQEDADLFANALTQDGRTDIFVEPRTLHYGQPSQLGWNT